MWRYLAHPEKPQGCGTPKFKVKGSATRLGVRESDRALLRLESYRYGDLFVGEGFYWVFAAG
jgi:hypothetical protein